MSRRAEQLVELLQLTPHPEGGFYREVSRSELTVDSGRVSGPRAAMTDIYFLLLAGQVSRWHRVAHCEVWNFYEGAALAIHQLSADLQKCRRHQLDPATASYKCLVPGGAWQAAETLGEYSLVGCTVAPGFDFADFQMMRNLPETAAKVYARYPDLAWMI